MPLESRLWQYAPELRTLLVTYRLCGSALTDTMDNPSEICPLKLTDFCLFLYHRSYTILQGPLIPPMAFTSCHDRGSNRLPPEGRANTLTTQPLRLAYSHILASCEVLLQARPIANCTAVACSSSTSGTICKDSLSRSKN